MNPGQCRYLKPGFNWAKGLLTPGVTLTLSKRKQLGSHKIWLYAGTSEYARLVLRAARLEGLKMPWLQKISRKA
jgi:hypothetical protein